MNLRRTTFIAGFTVAALSITEARTTRRLPSSIGEPVSSLPLAHLDGSTGSLDDYRGRFVIVDIWTTWCRPYRAEIADLERLAQRYADKGVVVVGIDEGEATQVVTDFINNNGLTNPVLLDPSLGYWKTYGDDRHPTYDVR